MATAKLSLYCSNDYNVGAKHVLKFTLNPDLPNDVLKLFGATTAATDVTRHPMNFRHENVEEGQEKARLLSEHIIKMDLPAFTPQVGDCVFVRQQAGIVLCTKKEESELNGHLKLGSIKENFQTLEEVINLDTSGVAFFRLFIEE